MAGVEPVPPGTSPVPLPEGEPPAGEQVQVVGRPPQPGQVRVYVARGAYRHLVAWARQRGRQGLATAGVLLGQPLRDRQGTLFVVVDGAVEAPGVEVAARSVRFPP
ncbi:MAG TPA: hypothetical protein VIL11_06840, partial [Limnochordales bacterium]